MARHGENIRKRADGRWEGRYQVYSSEKGRNIYRSVYGKSYDEVKEKRKQILTGGNQGSRTASRAQSRAASEKNIDFDTAAKEWMAEKSSTWKYSTYVKYETIYRKYLSAAFGAYPITDLINLSVSEAFPDALSDSSSKSIYCVLNQILAYAEQRYSVPIQKPERTSAKMKKKPAEILNRQEQEKLLFYLYCDMDRYKMAVILCISTGIRLGEACALKWSDIDEKNRVIAINKTVQRIAAEGGAAKTILLETSPKSETSKRELPVSQTLMGLMLKFKDGGKYVLGGEKPAEPRTLQYCFKRYLRRAGIPDKNFHTLRHTFATNCMEHGIDAKALSELLGHSDVQITLNRYVHPSMDVKRKSLNRLWQFYGQFLGQIEAENLES